MDPGLPARDREKAEDNVSITREHYRIMAESLSDCQRIHEDLDDNTVGAMIWAVCLGFQRISPNFDWVKFQKACEPNEEVKP